jgi:hypothetical protein
MDTTTSPAAKRVDAQYVGMVIAGLILAVPMVVPALLASAVVAVRDGAPRWAAAARRRLGGGR